MIESIKTGVWLTPERLRIYPRLLLAIICGAVLLLIATSHGNYDRFGRPLGPDFSEIWVAGQDVRAGHPAAAYDPAAHRAKQAEFFGQTPDFYLWSYPPYFLCVAAALAFFPYLLALLIWQVATFLIYLAAMWRIVKSTGLSPFNALGPALAFPAVFVNLAHGQNGFLTAALLAGGLLSLKCRPLLAGVLFACLAYKPQFALLIPIALIAGGYWRTIISGTLTLGLLTLGTCLVFGLEVWPDFFAGIRLSQNAVLEQGGAGYEKMQSIFAAARLLGASIQEAYVLQACVIIMLAGGIAWLWRSPADHRLKGAALLAGALIATPYCFDYDMVILGPALALAISYGCEKGFQPYEKTILALAWISPLIARPLATAISSPIGAFTIALLFFAVILQARYDLKKTQDWKPALGQI